MTDDATLKIDSVADFIAHMIALKHDAQERLQLLSECLTEHNNPQAANVFGGLLVHVNDNLTYLESLAIGLDLPKIAPWEYQWNDLSEYDNNCIDQAHYLMTGREALQLVLSNEQRNLVFLERVNQQVSHPDVQQLSRQLLAMEKALVKQLQGEMEASIEDQAAPEDLDPPNIPE